MLCSFTWSKSLRDSKHKAYCQTCGRNADEVAADESAPKVCRERAANASPSGARPSFTRGPGETGGLSRG